MRDDRQRQERERARQEFSYWHSVYVPYDWVDPDANADYRCVGWKPGAGCIDTRDKYAAWCKKHACSKYNMFSAEWCASGGDDACKNECRARSCPWSGARRKV